MKSTLGVINNKFQYSKKNSKLEDKTIETIQNKTQREKMGKNYQ